MFDIISSNGHPQLKSVKFWETIQDNQLIPERTAEQMRNFYKTWESHPTEQWLVKAIHKNVEYSLSVPSIPNEEFLQNFKQKYRNDFLRLQNGDQDDPDETGYNKGYPLSQPSSFGADDQRDKKAGPTSHYQGSLLQGYTKINTNQGSLGNIALVHKNQFDGSVIKKVNPVSYKFSLKRFEPVEQPNRSVHAHDGKDNKENVSSNKMVTYLGG